jgi:hypothetical protein
MNRTILMSTLFAGALVLAASLTPATAQAGNDPTIRGEVRAGIQGPLRCSSSA